MWLMVLGSWSQTIQRLEAGMPHLSLHRKTENLVGFLVLIHMKQTSSAIYHSNFSWKRFSQFVNKWIWSPEIYWTTIVDPSTDPLFRRPDLVRGFLSSPICFPYKLDECVENFQSPWVPKYKMYQFWVDIYYLIHK